MTRDPGDPASRPPTGPTRRTTSDVERLGRRYSESDQVWSGRPNGALVAEIEGLSPGRALDVGCGEGAHAVWLTRQGWQVTALDVSRVALERPWSAPPPSRAGPR